MDDRRVFVSPDVNLADAKATAAEQSASADRCAWLAPRTAVIVNVEALHRLLGWPLPADQEPTAAEGADHA